MINIRVLMVEACASLSHRSMLTFQIGTLADGNFALRLVENTGKGHFSDAWIAWPAVLERIQAQDVLSCSTLQPLFEGRSINTGGFLLAVLRHLGVVELQESGRGYRCLDLSAFSSRMTALMTSSASLPPEARPAPPKPRRRPAPSNREGTGALDS